MEQCDRNNVILMLGSNTGDRKATLDKAVVALRKYVDIETVTRDIDNPDFTGRGPDYLNRLVLGLSRFPFDLLKSALRDIESSMDRDRTTPGLVTIDIDIVVCNDRVIKPSEYTSPPCRTLLRIAQKNQSMVDY